VEKIQCKEELALLKPDPVAVVLHVMPVFVEVVATPNRFSKRRGNGGRRGFALDKRVDQSVQRGIRHSGHISADRAVRFESLAL
jgi:hypothetical protein